MGAIRSVVKSVVSDVGGNVSGIGGFSWLRYWSSLISATVEDASPTDVILTFPSAKSLVYTGITATVNGIARVVSSASWTGAVWTVVLASDVIYGDVVVMTFGKTGQTKAVTNNVIYSMLLTSTGTGVGVSTLKMTVSDDIIVTLGDNAKFYSDSGGTADESSTWSLTAGGLRIIYLKCTTGTATMKFSDVTKVTSWGEWISSTNAASISGDISRFISLTYLNAWGSNTISGNITGLTSLTYLLIGGSNTITGSIAGLTSLTYLNIRGSSAVSGSIAGLTLLTYLYITGSSTVSGSIATNVLDELTDCYLLPCGMVDYTAGQIWPDIRVTINPFAGYGYDSTEIDNILIDMAASDSMSGKTITLTGSSAARTAASDAAVLKLETADSGYVHLVNTIKTN